MAATNAGTCCPVRAITNASATSVTERIASSPSRHSSLLRSSQLQSSGMAPALGLLLIGVIGGGKVVLEFGVAELIDRANGAEQAEAVGVIEDEHQLAR